MEVERTQKGLRTTHFSLSERFEHGNFTLAEIKELKPTSHSAIYEHIAKGILETFKAGRRTLVRGPVARRYIGGEQ